MISLKSFAAKTHQGPYLQINEDGHEIDLNQKLYLIYDGFGGSSVGDKAVALVNETVKSFYTRIAGDPDSTLPFYYSPKYLLEGNALVNAMEYAHFLLKKENKDKEMNNRGGVSAIGVAQAENLLTIAGTGNCLALLYSKGEMKSILEPDSFELVCGDHFERHFTTAPSSGFGLFDELHLQVRETRVSRGDKVILLTDGVYSRVKESEIKDMLQRDKVPLQEKINELFALSNGRGNLDNQTMVILDF